MIKQRAKSVISPPSSSMAAARGRSRASAGRCSCHALVHSVESGRPRDVAEVRTAARPREPFQVADVRVVPPLCSKDDMHVGKAILSPPSGGGLQLRQRVVDEEDDGELHIGEWARRPCVRVAVGGARI